ncbi:hypothetical protein B0T22DRAFT_464624 [Podospora appendiculata]|uniref:Uncharacterized protein n=1 Tax=Podospora appendiculata TaxID=314037 RepID=A0AAE0X4L1_9PEZI|nr:hypothetical protein B0T22DRAFT_464624 [Podospora appendiculata]
MGRLGPLTSQALGRSPYDDVVQGEGPPGPPSSLQQEYDERGRPVNPETKRINRDIIRAHNEVMLVIGVAEPENNAAEAQRQVEVTRQYNLDQDLIGRRLLFLGGVLETVGIWGVNGMRQRILLYKQYARVPFHELYELQRSQQSWSSYFGSGLASFIASCALGQVSFVVPSIAQYLSTYVQLHLELFHFFQRTGIVSSSRFLPSWRFFIPGTSDSPIPIPHLPTSFSREGLLQWLGSLALGTVPFAGFYLYSVANRWFMRNLRYFVLQNLPRPYNATKRRQPLREIQPPQPPPVASTTVSLPPPAEVAVEDQPRTGHDPSRVESAVNENVGHPPALPGYPPGHLPLHPPLPPPPSNPPRADPVRRQSLVSVREDEFASDDEEQDGVSATLISFDVEATESTDTTTPGVWSAELRPNVSDLRSLAGQEPRYRDNALARLPSILAADTLSLSLGRFVMAPLESLALVRVARGYMMRHGMSVEGVHDLAFWDGSWRRMVNVLGVELVLLLIHGEMWGVVCVLADHFRISEEEWKERNGIRPQDDEEFDELE